MTGVEGNGAEHSAGDLIRLVSLLAATVIAVPLFRRIGLGSVLGYLAAGLAIGPFGLALFSDPAAILHVAELGVVMFLFIIGLEMRPSHLWHLRGQIFGLGSLQIGTAIVALTAVGLAFGLSPVVAFIGGAGFVLTSTAIVFQALSERGDIATARGQKMVSVLLFEDMLIVPLLALVAFMAPAAAVSVGSRWLDVLVGMGAIAGLVAVGLWVLNPLFRYLAASRAREVMTAAALLVVLGSALLMELSGLSMAMGAFLAGVLLSESSFRHQLEVDIEPFRGLLLGLFFLAVGMSLDLAVVAANWALIAAAVPAMMLAKAVCIYGVARMLRSGHDEALDRSVLMAQGGEFAFVLYAAAAGVGLISAQVNANLTAIVVLSMVLTPLLLVVLRPLLRRGRQRSFDGVESAKGLSGNVLVVGFGRFGQVACQSLLAGGVDVSIIDSDPDMIRNAERFGFKVYYGDGTRLDILHASGADSACAILVCVDEAAVASQIAQLVRDEFPQAKVLVRAYDREHARALVNLGVHFQMRETFESAMRFGREALQAVGVNDIAAAEVSDDIRRRDLERFNLEVASGSAQAGMDRLYRNAPAEPAVPLQPGPLVEPRSTG